MDETPLGEEGLDGDPFSTGWWVGSDGYWHPPADRFEDDVPDRHHPVRRVAILLLVVALVGATTVGVWAGVGSRTTTSPTGPSLADLTSQVRLAVTGTGANEFGVGGVTGLVCHPPGTWGAGETFSCDVHGSSGRELGVYHGTVATSAPGEWRWSGVWDPSHRDATTD